nr:hypothetical protein [Clostridiales bacterium]
VEIETNATSAHPASLAGLSPDGSYNSYFYYTDMSSYYYVVSLGDDPMEFCILSHIISAAPAPIAKSGWISASGDEIAKPTEKYRTMVEDKEEPAIVYPSKIKRTISNPVKGIKAMNYYTIYRNDVAIGTSTTTSYEDTSVSVTGDYTYKVTADYADPEGESLPTNEIVLHVEAGGSLTAPTNVATSISGSDIVITWDAVAGASGYNVYSSADPYGTFNLVTTVGTNSYTVATGTKLFYYFTSTDAKTAAPKTIEVRKSETR